MNAINQGTVETTKYVAYWEAAGSDQRLHQFRAYVDVPVDEAHPVEYVAAMLKWHKISCSMQACLPADTLADFMRSRSARVS